MMSYQKFKPRAVTEPPPEPWCLCDKVRRLVTGRSYFGQEFCATCGRLVFVPKIGPTTEGEG